MQEIVLGLRSTLISYEQPFAIAQTHHAFNKITQPLWLYLLCLSSVSSVVLHLSKEVHWGTTAAEDVSSALASGLSTFIFILLTIPLHFIYKGFFLWLHCLLA